MVASRYYDSTSLVFLAYLFYGDLDWISMDDSEEITQARCHFIEAEVDGIVFTLEDEAYVKVNLTFENSKSILSTVLVMYVSISYCLTKHHIFLALGNV